MTDKKRRDEDKVFKWMPWVLTVIMGLIVVATEVKSCVITPNLDSVYQTKAHAKEADKSTSAKISENRKRLEDHEKRLTRTEALMERIEKTLDKIEPILYRRTGRK